MCDDGFDNVGIGLLPASETEDFPRSDRNDSLASLGLSPVDECLLDFDPASGLVIDLDLVGWFLASFVAARLLCNSVTIRSILY